MPDQGPNPGSDGLTRAEVWRLFESYNERWRDSHERMRNALDRNTQAMADGFEKMHSAFEEHEDADRLVERRVYDMEQREKTDKATIAKRHLAASGMMSVILGPLAAWFFRKFLL